MKKAEEAAGRAGMPIIDAHCDALLAVIGKSMIPGETGPRDFLADNPISHIDLPKLKRGRVICQFMAIFAEDSELGDAFGYTHRLIDEFEKICVRSGGDFYPVRRAGDLDPAGAGKRVGALLSIEGAEALEGNPDNLDSFHARGVRAIGLTWSRRNPFGRGVKTEGTDGLSSLGMRLVEKMDEMRMIVDASHLSDEAFTDLEKVSKRPFIASHSNCRELNDHPRNLTDSQIRAIAKSGGAVGAVFVPYFVSRNPDKSYLEHLLDHIDRVVDKGGLDCAAIGSDFEGYKGVEGSVIANAGEFDALREGLAARGYSHASMEKILWKNWERVIRDVLG